MSSKPRWMIFVACPAHGNEFKLGGFLWSLEDAEEILWKQLKRTKDARLVIIEVDPKRKRWRYEQTAGAAFVTLDDELFVKLHAEIAHQCEAKFGIPKDQWIWDQPELMLRALLSERLVMPNRPSDN